MAEKLLRRYEVADMLGIRTQTLAVLAMTGKHLPFVKVGRSVRYRESDVTKYLDANTVAKTAD